MSADLGLVLPLVGDREDVENLALSQWAWASGREGHPARDVIMSCPGEPTP